jgi:hypothetical protein
MNKRKFLYFLTDAAGLSYYVDNGVVKTSGSPVPLANNPDGWNEKAINFNRNTTYYGVFRSFTIPLRFVKDAALILRTRLYNNGGEDIVNLIILRLNPLTGKHDAFYKGEIDFNKYNDGRDFFEVNVLEGGFPKYLKAYESTTFEKDLSDSTINIRMDGIDLYKKVLYGIYAGTVIASQEYNTVGCVFARSEGTSFGIIEGSSPLSNADTPFDSATDEDRFLLKSITETITITATGSVKFDVTGAAQNVRIYFVKSDGNEIDIVPWASKAVGTYTVTINLTFALNADERLFLIVRKTPDFIGNRTVVFYDTDLTISFKTHYKTTTIKAIKPIDWGTHLLQQMAGASTTLTSAPLSTTTILLTSGDAIRGIADAKIKGNFKDFFTSFNRNLNIGLDYSSDTAVNIKAKADYYNNTVVYNLGEVNDAKFKFAEDLLFSKFKIGYPNQDYDDVNGREEFNTTHEYKSPISRNTKDFDLSAPYRADMYGIEFTRINLEGKTTTDSSSDNDIFMIDAEYVETIDGQDYYRLRRPTYSSITGLLDTATAFNIELSPKRCLLNHGAWLRGCMWPYDGRKLTFQTSDKNPNLKTVQSGVTIQENADITIGDLATPLFVPIVASFEAIVPEALLSLMATNAHGLFTFSYLGKTYKGWVLKASQKPSDDEAQEWDILLSYDNNINDLIHG